MFARLRAALPKGRTLPLPLWQRRHSWMVALLWAHVVIVPVVGMIYSDYSLGHSFLHALPILAFALMSLLDLPRRTASVVVSAGLLTCSAMLVHVTNGLIESHFHFFVMMGILALYEDWAPYVLAFTYVWLHHGVLGTIAPDHVFNHGGSAWGWAIVHAGFIGAAGVANVVSWRMNEAMRAYAAAEGRGRQEAEAIARTLRESLMPEPLPPLSDARVAARYLTGEGEIGGDWFEVIELPSGDIAVALGDVAGRGVAAAVLTSKLRHTLRAHATEGLSPAAILERLDRITEGSFATVAYAIVSPKTETVRISSAGHPPPLLIDSEGNAEFADRVQGPPLAGFGGPFPESAFRLPHGSSLVFYTDGLVERRGESIDASLERLRAAATGLTQPPEALCSRLLFGLVPDGSQDDVALVALQAVAPASEARITVPAAPQHVAALRRSARKWSAAAGVPASDLESVTVAVGEAAANAVEHSGSETIEMHLRIDGDFAEIVIRDFGTWREPVAPPPGDEFERLLAPRGRGLGLMSVFAADAKVDKRPDGTSVTLRFRRGVSSQRSDERAARTSSRPRPALPLPASSPSTPGA